MRIVLVGLLTPVGGVLAQGAGQKNYRVEKWSLTSL
jgi:hypothetical protein